MELSEPWHSFISVFFRGLSILTSRSYLYVLIVISESFHYVSPFPSASFSIILAFQFMIWFPTHKYWRSAFSFNTPRDLTSLKLCQIIHSFSLRVQLQVSPVPQSCPLSVTPHPQLRLDSAAHTQLHKLRHKGVLNTLNYSCSHTIRAHTVRFLQQRLFASFPTGWASLKFSLMEAELINIS